MAEEEATQEEQPRLWQAIEEAVLTVMDRETEYDSEKLAEKLRQYFKRGAKNLDLKSGRPWQELVNEFADGVFGSIYSGLGEREWLPEVDFQMCFDLAVQEIFPGRVLKNVSPEDYMEVSMQAADRAIDENRYSHARWQTISTNIEGKMTTKRVSAAVDTARAMAREAGANSAEEFLQSWVTATLKVISEGVGNPRNCIDEEKATVLFNALVQDNCLPLVLVEGGLPEDGSPMISDAVSQAYSTYPAEGEEFVAPVKKITGAGIAGKRMLTPQTNTTKPAAGGLWGPSGIGAKPKPSGGLWGASQNAVPAAWGGKGGGKTGGGFEAAFGGKGGAYTQQVKPQWAAKGVYPVDNQAAAWGAPAAKKFKGAW